MTGVVLKPVICPVLIGRTGTLRSMRVLLNSPRGQRSNVLLIHGEAGIGKSRLISEFCLRAVEDGYRVLRGHCFQPDRADAFAPLRDLLRAQFGRILEPSQIDAQAPLTRELIQFLPDIVPLPTQAAPPENADPAGQKRRLFTLLTSYFQRLISDGNSRPQPLLLVFEDLHWSDDASLEFFLHLARQSIDWPLLICLSYRSNEIQPSLAQLLVHLDRAHLAHEYPLDRLARDEVEAMVRATLELERPVRTEFLDTLFQLTEGNPFFVEEILKSLLAAGDIAYGKEEWERRPLDQIQVPRSVQDAVQRRAETLSPRARQVLLLAAVIGHRFHYALLLELAEIDERQLLEIIKELIAAQLVIEESADKFAFRHALTRQAIYAQLLARERRAYHRVLAEAIERIYGETPDRYVVDLAFHAYEGGLWEKAASIGQCAGQQAFRLYAPRAAHEHYARAAEAMRQLGKQPDPGLLLEKGRCAEMFGDFNAAFEDYQSALESARARQDPEMEWRVLLETGFLFHSRDLTQARHYFHQALDLARNQGEPIRIAHSLNRLGNWHTNQEQPDAAIPLHQEALDIFEELADSSGLAETYDLLGMANRVAGDLVQSYRHFAQAVDLYRALENRRGLAAGLVGIGLTGFSQVYMTEAVTGLTLEECDAAVEEALAIAREINWPAGESYAAMACSARDRAQGRFVESWRWAQTALEIAQNIQHDMWITAAYHALGNIASEWCAASEALPYLEKAWQLAGDIDSTIWQNHTFASLVTAYLLAGELPRADALLDERWHRDLPARAQGQRLIWRAHVELELARGNAEAALAGVERLLAATQNLEAEPAAGNGAREQVVVPRLWYLWGQALTGVSRYDEAELRLREALEQALRFGIRPLIWRLQLALGQLFAQAAQLDAADQAIAVVRQEVESLLPEAPSPALANSLQQYVAAQIPAAFREDAQAQSQIGAGFLTPREQEVARLVAQGATNREIAAQLVISERTAETHVGNILNKLDFASRAQIAAWVVEQGQDVKG